MPNHHFIVPLLQAACLYFAFVFGSGFVLGPIRIWFVVPRLGVRYAELLEMPIMLLVMIFASKKVLAWYAALWTAKPSLKLALGILGASLGLSAELFLIVFVQKISLADYYASRDVVSGTVFHLMLIVMAILPILVS